MNIEQEIIDFKTGQKVDVFLYGDTERKIPFDKAVISDKGDKLNDPDVLRVTIYKGRSAVGCGYYNREWIKPQKFKLNVKLNGYGTIKK